VIEHYAMRNTCQCKVMWLLRQLSEENWFFLKSA